MRILPFLPVSLLTLLAAACGSNGASDAAGEKHTSSTHIQLTAPGEETHTLYRLGPATFHIESVAGTAAPITPMDVSADVDQDSIDIPLSPGYYTITLKDGWVLESEFESTLTPVQATLTSNNPQTFTIEEFHTTSIRFDFVLGVSQLEVGIGVYEGSNRPPGYIPYGYDGVIEPVGDGRYRVLFKDGGGACCFASVDEAHAAYPQYNLYAR